MTYLKNIIEEKFNYIFEKFIKYFQSSSNFVEKEFIYGLQINNSKCVIVSHELNKSISEYLNANNLTKFEGFIENNCTSEGIINSLINN